MSDLNSAIISDLYAQEPPAPTCSWRGQFYRWTGTHYRQHHDADMQAELCAYIADLAPKAATPQMVQSVTDALHHRLHRPTNHEPENLIVCRNHAINLNAWLEGRPNREWRLHHSPDRFVVHALPYQFDPWQTCDLFDGWMQEFTGQDAQALQMIQQFFGSVLLSELRTEYFLWLSGPPRSGKSTLADLMTYVLGEDNVSGLSPTALAGNHEIEALLHARLNVASEFTDLKPSIEEAVKRITSHDLTLVNPKYRRPYTARIRCRLMFLSNSISFIQDRSGAFWRRALIYPCRMIVEEGAQIKSLQGMLRDEAAGILRWVMEGARNLLEQEGHILIPEATQELIAEQREIDDPHRRFVEEELEYLGEECSLALDRIYERYTPWLEKEGHKQPLAKARLGRVIREAFPDVQIDRRRVHDPHLGRSDRQRLYLGLAWKHRWSYGNWDRDEEWVDKENAG